MAERKTYHFSPVLHEIRECHAKSQVTCPYCNAPHFTDLKEAQNYLNEMNDCFETMKKFEFLDNDYMHKDRGLYGDGGRLGDTTIHSYTTLWYDKDDYQSKLQCENVLQAAGLTEGETKLFLQNHRSFAVVNAKEPEIGIAHVKVVMDAQQNVPELKEYFATHTKAPIKEKFDKVIEYYRYFNTEEFRQHVAEQCKAGERDSFYEPKHLYERTGYFPSTLTKEMTENYIIGLQLEDKKLDRDLRDIYATSREDFQILKK